ncbi:hypothetical protein THAOC_33405 [Thalassiosira oceanica]|uniref:Uncharacterized protein n=1 Tax=Thalassiosira oceanica TaxID=159749 RepID=K0RFW2_THAOC|nr:hypothetical protein THAOC_33405 [Thalassiosira oceanica]|eukprot:EJK47851.1 hypothetical protein THAOC_33405 [Thalassiosira oceanica]
MAQKKNRKIRLSVPWLPSHTISKLERRTWDVKFHVRCAIRNRSSGVGLPPEVDQGTSCSAMSASAKRGVKSCCVVLERAGLDSRRCKLVVRGGMLRQGREVGSRGRRRALSTRIQQKTCKWRSRKPRPRCAAVAAGAHGGGPGTKIDLTSGSDVMLSPPGSDVPF